MKFFIYPVESFVEITGKEWSITPMTGFFDKSKPVMNNAFHVIGDFDSIPTINSWLECDFLIVPLLIRHTDDDYNNWSQYRNVDLSAIRSVTYQNGSFRRRAYEFFCTDNQPLRLQACEVDVDPGVT